MAGSMETVGMYRMAQLQRPGSFSLVNKGQEESDFLYYMQSLTSRKNAIHATPAALESISQNFSNSMRDEVFVEAVAQQLAGWDFNRDNSIAFVNTCRDEVCRPLATCIDKQFGVSFNVSGLGGLISCGTTGLRAGMSHSPQCKRDGESQPIERYVFFAFPHVAVGPAGELGSLLRQGRENPTHACGALIAIQQDAANAGEKDYDEDDMEYVMLKRKIRSQLACNNCGGQETSLADITKTAMKVITEDLERLIQKTVNPATADYAVITGIQIHSSNQASRGPFRPDRLVDYVYPGTMYAVVRGQKHDLQVV